MENCWYRCTSDIVDCMTKNHTMSGGGRSSFASHAKCRCSMVRGTLADGPTDHEFSHVQCTGIFSRKDQILKCAEKPWMQREIKQNEPDTTATGPRDNS